MQPLDYVIFWITINNTVPHPIFLDDHVSMGKFNGKDLSVYAATVYKIIINLCDVNKNLHDNVKSLMMHQDVSMGYNTLQNHYKGMGIHAKYTSRATDIL